LLAADYFREVLSVENYGTSARTSHYYTVVIMHIFSFLFVRRQLTDSSFSGADLIDINVTRCPLNSTSGSETKLSARLISKASAAAALVLWTSPQSLYRQNLQIASASAQQLGGNKPTERHAEVVNDHVALHLSPHGPASICSEVLIRPRNAELTPPGIGTCEDLARGTSRAGCEQAEPVYGFVIIDGTGYEIDGIGCSPLGDASNSGSGKAN
jgi:hypothetical protein